MSIDTSALKSACRYEQYDPVTLKPLNASTYTRLIETGWTEEILRGKSVLDIGCNLGALSLFAHNLGAVDVKATDVTAQFVDFFSQVIALHKLPISVEKIAFFNLEPEHHGSDVVFCMEVLHWIVHQGGTIDAAVAHLAALTGELLYLETPWDIKEPSIRDRNDYPLENYDIELIMRALSRHFEEVRIEKFMTYFGAMQDSKRVLISARKKRASSLPLRHIRDANISDISLSRGVNPSYLVTTTKGAKVLKTIPPHSVFARLGAKDLAQLAAFLNAGGPQSVIVPPEDMGGRICQIEEDGKAYMMFPFVGDLARLFPQVTPMPVAKDPLPLALGLFKHFSQVSAELLAPVHALHAPLLPVTAVDIPAPFDQAIAENGLNDFIDIASRIMTGMAPESYDGLLHGDMQLGNMIEDATGRGRLVDLDLLRSGPAYSDLLCCAVHTNQSLGNLKAALDEAATHYARPVAAADIAFSTHLVLTWCVARARRPESIADQVPGRVAIGLKHLSDLMVELG
jgi:hypothetical protein